MGDAIALEVRNINKTFPGVKALKDVSLQIRKGEVHALCGENGAGKSTLMHILAGVYRADSGQIFLDGKAVKIENQKHANDLGISIVYQERSLVPGLNIAENIYAGRQPVNMFGKIKWKTLYQMTNEHLQRLNIKLDPKLMVGSIAPPIQQMVEIAKALSFNSQVIILDEPTATITEKEVAALFGLLNKLKEDGMAIIYISHRLAEIFQVADRVSVLKDGVYMGTEDVSKIDQNWIVKKMVGRDVYFECAQREVADRMIMECRNFSGCRFRNINFKLKKGEILAFAGLAGAGRTEVFRAIFGADPKTGGDIYLEEKKLEINNCMDAIKAGIGYLPEDRKEQGLFLEMSYAENVASGDLGQFQKGIELDNKLVAQVAEDYRKKLSIATPSIKQKVINLSGGNQQKVVIAKWLLVDPKIMIVDEPTRGVDVGAKSEIYSILRELTKKGTSIIVISSDLPEVLSISDRIYVMWNGIITGELQSCDATEERIMQLASGIGCDDGLKEECR